MGWISVFIVFFYFPTFTLLFLIIAMVFSFGEAPFPCLCDSEGIHLILWFQGRPRPRTFVATMGKEIQPFH